MNENQLAQENFNLPHDVLTLPSKGIFYKNKKRAPVGTLLDQFVCCAAKMIMFCRFSDS